jgi:hypothetical protein
MSESESKSDDRKDVPDPEDRSITGAVPADEEISDGETGQHPEDNPDKEGEDRFDAG